MKISKDQLLSSDFDTLFTHNPGTFFEAVLINILWGEDGKDIDQELIGRQRFIFEKWHEYFSNSLRTDIEKQNKEKSAIDLVKAEAKGFKAGQIFALHNLPFKKSALGKTVDINAVTELLRQLKAKEPIGVVEHGAKVS